MQQPEILSFLIGCITITLTFFFSRAKLKLTNNDHRQKQKNRVFDIYLSLPSYRSPTDEELAVINHAFYDYSKNKAQAECVYTVVSSKTNPVLFEQLSIAGDYVEYDHLNKRIVRSRTTAKSDNYKRIASILTYCIFSIGSLTAITTTLEPITNYFVPEDGGLKVFVALVMTVLYMSPVIVTSILTVPIVKRIDAISALTKA
ncbi:hypothetical protein [Halomonas sp. WWR20]